MFKTPEYSLSRESLNILARNAFLTFFLIDDAIFFVDFNLFLSDFIFLFPNLLVCVKQLKLHIT